jgi:hypothetical protein
VWQQLGKSPVTVHLGKIAALFGCGRTVVYRAIHEDAASSTASRVIRRERIVATATGRLC